MSAERNRASLSAASMRQAPSSSRNPCFPVQTSSPSTREGARSNTRYSTALYIHHPCREHYALPKCPATAVVFKSCQHSSGLASAATEQVAWACTRVHHKAMWQNKEGITLQHSQGKRVEDKQRLQLCSLLSSISNGNLGLLTVSQGLSHSPN
jgi:hypothetical protein